MNNNDNWIPFKPADNVSQKYSIDFLKSSIDDIKFKIILSDANNIDKKIIINIAEGVDFYGKIQNEAMLKVIKDIEEKYGKDFHQKWTFFKIENSSYIKWLSDESCGIWNFSYFTHYALIGIDSILYFLSSDDDIEIKFLE